MKIHNVIFFALFALCLIGCSSGSSDISLIDIDDEADVFVSINGSQRPEIYISEADEITFTLSIGNYGPEKAKNVSVTIIKTDPYGIKKEVTTDLGTMSVEEESGITNAGYVTSGPGIYFMTYQISTSTLDSSISNNIATLIINVTSDEIIAPVSGG